jgi:hypothetical protein
MRLAINLHVVHTSELTDVCLYYSAVEMSVVYRREITLLCFALRRRPVNVVLHGYLRGRKYLL